MDRGLRFNLHLQTVTRQASLRVSTLCRVATFLNRRGTLLLHKAQIKPYLEYAALTWMSSAAFHLRKLDRVERCTIKLVDGATHQPSNEVSALDPIDHRQDVGALLVLQKSQIEEMQHFARLRLGFGQVSAPTDLPREDHPTGILISHT